MEIDAAEETTEKEEQPSCSMTGRHPPIVLNSVTNLIQFQRNIKDIVNGSF
jgi:hypothetical protein